MALLMIVIGLIALTAGADLLVRGANGLARAMGMPALIIGLTVVAFGTSAPELAVSVKAGLEGQADIALGNVVGSNIFNVLLILGLSALVLPLSVSSQLIRLDVPVMIGVSGLAWLLASDGRIIRWEGAALTAGLIAYTALLIWMGKRTTDSPDDGRSAGFAKPSRKWIAANVFYVAIGLVLLVLGARALVNGAVDLARALGVNELLIGLTIVAAGTSLPELATSVIAAVRGERDIAVGNVVGSNIFNILGVLGVSAMVSGNAGVAPGALRFDVPVMTAVSVACLPVFFTGGRISRWEGAIFTLYYIAYVTWLVLTASLNEASSAFGWAMLTFALPATLLGLGVSLFYALRSRRSRPA